MIEDLVLANRLLASAQARVLTPDGLAHVSARSRTNPNHFYIAHDVAPGMVTAADIVEDDLDAKPVKGGDIAQYSERFIHSEIYRARPEVMAVLHAHTPELRVFGQSNVKLRPVSSKAIFIGEGLPIFDIVKFDPKATGTLISSPALGRALVGVMGNKDGSLLLDHGIALADYSVRALVSRAFNFAEGRPDPTNRNFAPRRRRLLRGTERHHGERASPRHLNLPRMGLLEADRDRIDERERRSKI